MRQVLKVKKNRLEEQISFLQCKIKSHGQYSHKPKLLSVHDTARKLRKVIQNFSITLDKTAAKIENERSIRPSSQEVMRQEPPSVRTNTFGLLDDDYSDELAPPGECKEQFKIEVDKRKAIREKLQVLKVKPKIIEVKMEQNISQTILKVTDALNAAISDATSGSKKEDPMPTNSETSNSFSLPKIISKTPAQEKKEQQWECMACESKNNMKIENCGICGVSINGPPILEVKPVDIRPAEKAVSTGSNTKAKEMSSPAILELPKTEKVKVDDTTSEKLGSKSAMFSNPFVKGNTSTPVSTPIVISTPISFNKADISSQTTNVLKQVNDAENSAAAPNNGILKPNSNNDQSKSTNSIPSESKSEQKKDLSQSSVTNPAPLVSSSDVVKPAAPSISGFSAPKAETTNPTIKNVVAEKSDVSEPKKDSQTFTFSFSESDMKTDEVKIDDEMQEDEGKDSKSANATDIQPAWGKSGSSNMASAFGTPAASTTSFSFSTPGITTSTQPNASGWPSSTANSNQTSSNTPPATAWGKSSVFGSTTTPSAFGQASNTSSPFGNQNSSLTAGNNPTNSAFGQPSGSSSSPFGKPSTSFGTQSAFGNSSSAFGSNSTTTPAFGSQNTATSSAFGATAPPSSAFGAQPASTSAFGGQPATTSAFGAQPATISAFGQSSSGSAFGNPSTTTSAFGSSNTASSGAGWGKQSNPFGGGAQ